MVDISNQDVRNIAQVLEKSGWQINFSESNTVDFVASKEKLHIAVKVENFKKNIGVPHVRKFLSFIDSAQSKGFKQFLHISATGYEFTPQAIALVEEMDDSRIKLATFNNGKLRVLYPPSKEDSEPQPNTEKTYIGVFTCKGGVGKTTISAHLAGALALTGYDVTLIDLDPEKNLNTLLPDGLFLPSNSKGSGNTLTVLYHEQFNPACKEKFIVCDCSPAFERNPKEIMQKFNYCIIPTTLNPLGINKNGHVIIATVKEIRAINPDAFLFVLINNYTEESAIYLKELRQKYRDLFAQLEQEDDHFKFIDPEMCAIHQNKQLFYWGMHLITGKEPSLAFQQRGKSCIPKTDFLHLVEYLEEQTQLKQNK